MHGDRKQKDPDELHVKRAANGGFIVRHSYDNSMSGPSYAPPTEHAFTSHTQARKHVNEHMMRMSGVQSGGDDLIDAAGRKGKTDAKKAKRLGKDEGAMVGTGSPRAIKKAPPKTSYGGTKKAPTKAQGRAAARTAGGGLD